MPIQISHAASRIQACLEFGGIVNDRGVHGLSSGNGSRGTLASVPREGGHYVVTVRLTASALATAVKKPDTTYDLRL